VGLVGQPRGDRRIESASGPCPNDPCRELRAAEQSLECSVPGHVNDPERKRDVVTPEPGGFPLPSQRAVR
jgi:hypothetical protein